MADSISDEINRWLSEAPLSANTTDRYRRALQLFLTEIADPSGCSPGELRAWLDSHPWGSSMQWVNLTAVKGFLRWRYGALHPVLSFKIRRQESPPQRALRIPQVRRLIQSFDTSTHKGKRDLSMCGLMLDCGLRVSEVCSLEVERVEYDPDLEAYLLQVVVKGGAWATRSFSAYTAAWYADWLAARGEITAQWPGRDKGRVFIGIGGNTPGCPMTRHGVQCIVRDWGERSGIGKLSPHDLRRSMASVATLLGAPEDIAMKGGGWKSSAVFRRYTVGVGVTDMKPYFPTTAAMED
jgi:site-specific recombinase XerD